MIVSSSISKSTPQMAPTTPPSRISIAVAAAHLGAKTVAQGRLDARVNRAHLVIFEGSIGRAVAQRKSHALPTNGDRFSAVDVEQLHAFQERSGRLANGSLDFSVWCRFVEDDATSSGLRR